MALNRNALVIELRKFMDQDYSGFIDYPVDEPAARQALANAVYEYSKAVSPVSAAPIALQAKNTMVSALTGMNQYEQGILVIKNALMTYAGVLGGGMSSGGFTILTPPPNPALPKLEDIKLEDSKTGENAANEFADIIHNWFILWKANNPVTGVTLNWS